MIGVWMTPCKNGQCELSVRRDGINKIVVSSKTPLTDAQAEELFWCIGAMQRSGKTLKDLLKEQESIVEALKSDLDETLAVLGERAEIVRCEDCVNCVKEPNGELYCDILAVGYEPIGSKKVNGDWFCADGKRKSDG